MEDVTGKTYSIKDLEELTGITVRNIRVYITEGLVPRPDGIGGGATYNDKHLLPLQVISLLHESNLKLQGIKEAMRNMTPEDMRSILANAESGKRTWDAESLKSWVNPGAPGRLHAPASNFSFAAIGTSRAAAQISSSDNILTRLVRTPEPEQETWQRMKPIDGVEVHVRDDIDPQIRQLVMQFVQQLRR